MSLPIPNVQVAITGLITPTSPTDTFAVHETWYGRGGFKRAIDLTERNSILPDRREVNITFCYVESTGRWYQLQGGIANTDWVDLGTSLGGGSSQWGDITGTITNQTDLINYISTQLSSFDLKNQHELFEHFLNGVIGTRYAATQSGGSAAIIGNNNILGVLRIRSGTGAGDNQRAGILSNRLSFLVGQGKAIQKNFNLSYSALPNVTVTGFIKVGFMDIVTTGYGVDGVFFRIVNDGNLTTVTRVSNVETVVDLGFRPITSTFYNHKILVNSAGTQVDFYFDNMVTPVSTHTTNIPSTSGAYLGEGFHVIRVAAVATDIFIDLDWDYLKVIYDTPLIF
jgi:hypothetical protein